MEFLDFILHAEKHLRVFIEQYGLWIYVLLFLIIFCETGLIITPFLPGDSLLFAIGALAADDFLNIHLTYWLLVIAAIVGDTVNYWIGRWCGPKVFHYENSRWFKREYLLRTHSFYEKYGGKAIILARFVPIIRTFAPFVAGIGTMNYSRFLFYNVVGAFAWMTLFLLGGYFLGNIPMIKQNFKLMILLIIFVSVLPIFYEWWKARKTRSIQI